MSNMAESLNSCLRTTQKLSIIVVVEKTRTKLVDFFFQAQDGRYPNDGVSNASSAFYTIRARGEIAPNDDPRSWPGNIVWSTPLHLCPTPLHLRPTTLTSSVGHVAVNNDRSQEFHAHMRILSLEIELQREEYLR